MRYKILSLKKLLEVFYIDEISKVKDIEFEDINYINSEEIYINKDKISKDSKKECFRLAENRVGKYLSTFCCNRKIIRLEEIIDYILDIIDKVKSLIGGKIILIEVLKDENSEKLIKRYEEVGFTSIGTIDDLTQLMTFSKNY